MFNRHIFIFFSWLLLIFLAQPILAKTEFSTGLYKDNQFNDEMLEVPSAYALIVTISGEIEDKWDILTLYDASGEKIGTFTGQMNERLEVSGNKIRVVFDSDNRRHNFPGVTVKIEAQSFPQLYQNIKQTLKIQVKNLLEKNTGEAAHLIQKHLKQVTQLDGKIRQAQDIAQIVKPVADELLKIAQTYRKIANNHSDIQKTHQAILSQLETLQTDTKHYQKIAQDQVAQFQADAQASTDNWHKDYLQQMASLSYTQQTLWNQFQQQQVDIMTQAKAYSNKVLDFLNFLNMTAQLYERTADLALVHQATVTDLQNLMDLSRLRIIVGEIQQYETQMNAIIEQIEKNSPLN